MEDLEKENLEYETVVKFLADLKKEFGGGDDKIIKVVKLKKIEQRNKVIEKFIQEFRRAVRESSYKERPLIKEFKREMNETI